MTAPPAEQEKGEAVVENKPAAGDGAEQVVVVAEASDADSIPVTTVEAEKPEKEQEVEEKEEEVEEKKEVGGDLATEAEAHDESPATPMETASFKEESYVVAELTEAERKALEAFRLKVEEAIKNKTILKKEKKQKEKEKEKPVDTIAVAPVEAVVETVIAEEELGVEEKPVKEEEKEEVVVEEKKEDREVQISDLKEQESAEAVEDADSATEPPLPKHETAFYLWGGIPVHAQEDEKTDVALLKFLRARNFKVEDALAMLKSTIRWRREFNADTIIEEELAEEGFEALAYQNGVDRDGYPVCYNLNPFQSKELIEDKAKLSRFLRWRVQLMEKSIRSLDFSPGGINSIVQVIDLQNLPGFRKASVNAIKKFLALLHDNYPELASKQILLNLPWYYVPAVYRSFHDKVVWAGPGKSTETLFKHIAPEHVPSRYGGLWRADDTEFQGVEAPVHELTLKGGEKQEIELPVAEGSRLLWDVSVVGWEVVYGEEFVPETYTIIVRKPKKIVASEQAEPIRNSFATSAPGKLVITIDNSLSKKKKTVVYRSKSTVLTTTDAL